MLKFISNTITARSLHMRSAHGRALATPSAPRSDPNQGRALAFESELLCDAGRYIEGNRQSCRQRDVNCQFLDLAWSVTITLVAAVVAHRMHSSVH